MGMNHKTHPVYLPTYYGLIAEVSREGLRGRTRPRSIDPYVLYQKSPGASTEILKKQGGVVPAISYKIPIFNRNSDFCHYFF